MLTIIIAGHIGQNAETKVVNDTTVTSFSVAHTTKDKRGDTTTWVRCALWGTRGEKLAQHLVKGKPVTVSGEGMLREYQKDGETRSSLELRVADVALQGGKGEGGGRSSSSSGSDNGYPEGWD